MKDFHDLYSLVSLPGCLNPIYAEKVVVCVFNHRGTSLQKLPLDFDAAAMGQLQSLWDEYSKGLKLSVSIPFVFGDVVSQINHWLKTTTTLCSLKNDC